MNERRTQRPATVLVVDDDPTVNASLRLLLEEAGYRARTEESPAAALAAVRETELSAVIQDLNFSRDTSGREGLDLLGRIREIRPELPVLLLTAWGSIDLAVEGMKAGASDFLTKPWSNEGILQSLETALALAGPDEAPEGDRRTRAELEEILDLEGVVGRDPVFLEVLEVVARVAPTDASVLLLGESGTGKEIVAELIHRNSRRRAGPFVPVNLGGISSTLFESEMFGHVRGAFTDARSDRQGRFEIAHGGTIFLDELGEVDPSSQVKLLRVLQDRSFEVLGSSRTRTVDVRVLSATNADLPTLVADGRFREDLLYRVNLITIRIPALRERPSDIPRLARFFLERAARIHDEDAHLADDALRWLRARPWPGNVRELEQTIQRAVLMLETSEIRAGDLEGLPRFATGAEAGAGSLPPPGTMTLDEIERAMIEKALDRFDGNITRTAEALGLTRQALYRRLEKYGLGDEGGP